MIQLRRVYDPPARKDGFRVLVDRLWPRGLAKQRAAIDLWLRDIAPTAGLRRWFAHEHKRWDEFCRRYARELEGKEDVLEFIRSKGRDGNVTLLFGARDRAFNNAAALRRILGAGGGAARLGRGAALAKGTTRGADRRTRGGRAASTRRLGQGHHRAARRRAS